MTGQKYICPNECEGFYLTFSPSFLVVPREKVIESYSYACMLRYVLQQWITGVHIFMWMDINIFNVMYKPGNANISRYLFVEH